MKAILRLASAILLAAPLGASMPVNQVPGDLVWAHSATTGQGVSSWYRFTVRAKNRKSQVVTWKLCVDGGFDPGFSPTMGTVTMNAYGWSDLSIPFSPPVDACPGEMSSFTIKLCANGMEIARDTGCISIAGEKAGIYYAPIDPQESHNFVGDKGNVDRISFVVKNEEPDFLPHAYDFLLFNEDKLAPGLDLYDLEPISGFDLPTVIGAGTPLMSGKLEEILPGDELLVEIEIRPIAHQVEGRGNLTTLIVQDDGTPGESIASAATVIRCSGTDAESHSIDGPNRRCLLRTDRPLSGASWASAIDASGHGPNAQTVLFVSTTRTAAMVGSNALLVDPRAAITTSVAAAAPDGLARHEISLPAALDGSVVFAQAAILSKGRIELCNAIELTVAPLEPDYRCVFHEVGGRSPH